MGILLIGWAVRLFFSNRPRFLGSLLLVGGAVASACLCYWLIPNPYELTHLPEYALLNVLLIRAMKRPGLVGRRGAGGGSQYAVIVQEVRDGTSRGISPYSVSLPMVGAFGAIDEVYQAFLPLRFFTWYDILLNGLGGVLGMALAWGISRE
jgi:hypothetical protein